MKAYDDLKKKLTTDNAYLLDERAAIMEFEGNMTKDEAETAAVKCWHDNIASKYSSQKSKYPDPVLSIIAFARYDAPPYDRPTA